MASSNPSPTLKQIAEQLLQETLNSIIHDIVIHRHRDHKLMIQNLDPTTKLPHCDRCNLPRLLSPPLAPSVRGATTDPPSETQYCDKKPWCRKPGHDIYGNPFPKGDVTGRPPTKKEREAAKNNNSNNNNNSKKDAEGTPASNEGGDNDGTAPPSPSAAEDGGGGGGGPAGANGKVGEKLEKGEKKASKIDEKLKKGEYIPWQTCPNCKRSLLITRFAKHLEQCMGLSGRAASRNAMAKMNGNGNGNGTPSGSRGGTPAPSETGGGGGGEEEEQGEEAGEEQGEEAGEDRKDRGKGGVRKKVLKKGVVGKIKKDPPKGLKGAESTNGKVSKTQPSKRPPPSSSSSAVGTEAKRDRDEMLLGDEGDDEDNVHVKKRQKVQRVGSTASIGSQQSTAPPPSAVELSREESNDGSFVD